MEDLQSVARIISDNEVSLQRRANMLGQHLANTGLDGVKIAIEVKITMNNSTGQHIRTISGEYSKYVAGVGDPKIGGQGAGSGSGWGPGGSNVLPVPAPPNANNNPSAGPRPGQPLPSAWSGSGGQP